MKKIVKGIVLLGSLLVLVSGCNNKKAKLVNSQELSTTDVEDISIAYNSDNVKFYENDSNKLRIEEYLLSNKEEQKASIQATDKKISIKGGNRRNFFISFGNDDSHIDIYLPKDYHENLNASVSSGSLKGTEPLSLNNFSASANSGSVKFDTIGANKTQLSATSGSLKVNRILGKETNIKSNSGSIHIGDINTPKLTCKATSGSIKIDRFKGYGDFKVNSGGIKLNQVTGGANIQATSGSINSSFKKVTDDITVKSNSGSIKLNIPQNLAFEFDGRVNSGSIKTDFEKELTKNSNQKEGTIGENPKVKIDTQATSGSIKVLRNK